MSVSETTVCKTVIAASLSTNRFTLSCRSHNPFSKSNSHWTIPRCDLRKFEPSGECRHPSHGRARARNLSGRCRTALVTAGSIPWICWANSNIATRMRHVWSLFVKHSDNSRSQRIGAVDIFVDSLKFLPSSLYGKEADTPLFSPERLEMSTRLA
jgi:hypothetical protein